MILVILIVMIYITNKLLKDIERIELKIKFK